MSLTNVLTLACTAAVAGIVAHHQLAAASEPAPPVKAYLGGMHAAAADSGSDAVAFIEKIRAVAEARAAAASADDADDAGAEQVLAGAAVDVLGEDLVTDTDLALAAYRWQERLDNAREKIGTAPAPARAGGRRNAPTRRQPVHTLRTSRPTSKEVRKALNRRNGIGSSRSIFEQSRHYREHGSTYPLRRSNYRIGRGRRVVGQSVRRRSTSNRR